MIMDIKIDQKNLRHEAYNKIKQMILDDVLKSGEKIFQEKMAQRLGISRIPLVQALSILQKERLIEYNARKGFTVRKISREEFFELLDLRGALEGLAVKKISQNLTDKIKKQLTFFLEEFENFLIENNNKKYSELDKRFHFFIVEECGISYIPHINNSFNILLLIYTKGFKSNLNTSIEDHRNIINAIINEQGELAAKIMEEHFEKAKLNF
jgi:DNA-binding GntR family transcriptional regulator